ncbi:FAD-binding oxidoreductase [Microvirga sp. BT689]|uniref:FAD-binding oxidoreductase n=1 Tax=Microvirga arvi TaxID=2778731 RepID=UPI00194E8857|nr:FAD-binding oxidoreductase [Microvirga arvi]MBM6580054.1 FAD-binding oxidoreductase [Microvirga arvi]
MTELTGWGRYPRHRSEALRPASPKALPLLMASRTGLVARGNGRAYGDAAIGERVTLLATGLDRIQAFDPATGRVSVEAGVLLSDLLNVVVPHGFFLPVVPGTKFVTIGGMIASDVHGKNHHRDGGFGDHVEKLTLALPDGSTVACSREENPELLAATIGGMGLTGTILDATFRLRSIETGWMRQTTTVARNLDDAIRALQETSNATYSVAWVDCLARGAALGRSLIFAAEHATLRDLDALRPDAEPYPASKLGRLAVPLDLPSFTLNRLSVSAFNEFYFRAGAVKSGYPFLVHWDPYFFPLDGIGNWNRIYGRRGFLQYQCVVPTAQARSALGSILERVSKHGSASFLAVLKQLGPGHGNLSFPLEGFTLTLDLPVSDEAFPLLDELDRLVVEARGRLYLAKDARQSPATFEAGYPGLPRFRDQRRAIGATGRISSRLSVRLGI